MKHTLKIKNDVYECVVYVIITDDIVKEATKVVKKLGLKDDVSSAACGWTIYHDEQIQHYYIVLSSFYVEPNTIAHEVHHLVSAMTRHRAILEEESQAWLVGNITAHIYRFISNKDLFKWPTLKTPRISKPIALAGE